MLICLLIANEWLHSNSRTDRAIQANASRYRYGWRSEAKRNTYVELQLIEGCHGASHAVASLGKETVNISNVVTAGGEGEDIIALQRLGQSRQDAVSR